MSTPRYRAWRFLHPDLDSYVADAGLQIGARGNIAMVEDQAAVRQSILLLLSTMPGERVMRPSYGCLLHRLIFSPNDDTTAGIAIHYVRRAIEQWEPRVDILRIDARRNPDVATQLDLVLEYRVRATQWVEPLQFSVHLAGGE